MMTDEFTDAAADTETSELAPGAKVDDPEAPYGFTSTGAVRNKPGRKPGQRTGSGRQRERRLTSVPPALSAPPRKAGPKGPAPKKTAVDYRPALQAISGQLIGSWAVYGLMKNSTVMLADCAAVADAAPSIIDGLNTAADKWPVVAAILDKVLPVAEFGKAGGALVLAIGQIAVNHGSLPAGLIPGTVPPERKVDAFIRAQMAASPEFADLITSFQAPAAPAATGAGDGE